MYRICSVNTTFDDFCDKKLRFLRKAYIPRYLSSVYTKSMKRQGQPYVTTEQQNTLVKLPKQRGLSSTLSLELPTLALGIGLYSAWLGLTFFYDALSLWIAAPLLAVIVCWQMHFQHECLHGHPTRNTLVNGGMAFWPLALWLPYIAFRRDHMAHHKDENLTDPLDDPESYFMTPDDWANAPGAWRAIRIANMTLLGRMTLGPVLSLVGFWVGETKAMARGNKTAWISTMVHLVGLAAVGLWLEGVAGFPLWLYLVAVALPATALSNIRTFAEHRLAEDPNHRTAIVENMAPFGWLFLFNNYHIVHHARPTLPWYAIPEAYRLEKAAWHKRNGVYVLPGYRSLLKYLVRPVAAPPHPGYGKTTEYRG